MEGAAGKTPFEQLIELVASREVEFVLIGGRAESLLGSPRITYDTDICYRRTPENLRRLAEALRELEVTLRGAPPDLPFQIDAQSLALGCHFTFRTRLGDLDLLGDVEPVGNFDELMKRAETVQLGDLTLRIISLDDLIRVKQHIKRSKDQDSLVQLLAIKRTREEQSQRPSGG